jgi:hypothetical protein
MNKDFNEKSKKTKRNLRTRSKPSKAMFIPNSRTGKCLNKQAQDQDQSKERSNGSKKSKSRSKRHDEQDLNYMSKEPQQNLNMSTSSSSSDDEGSVTDAQALLIQSCDPRLLTNQNFSDVASFDGEESNSESAYSEDLLSRLKDFKSLQVYKQPKHAIEVEIKDNFSPEEKLDQSEVIIDIEISPIEQYIFIEDKVSKCDITDPDIDALK